MNFPDELRSLPLVLPPHCKNAQYKRQGAVLNGLAVYELACTTALIKVQRASVRAIM